MITRGVRLITSINKFHTTPFIRMPSTQKRVIESPTSSDAEQSSTKENSVKRVKKTPPASSEKKIHPMFLPKQQQKALSEDKVSDKKSAVKNDNAMDKKTTNKKSLPSTDQDTITFAQLTDTFTKIEATTKRLEITDYLTQFYKQVILTKPEELLMTLYLTINRLCPDYEGLELGIGESILIKAVVESTGRTTAKVKEELKKVGDLGTVAQSARKNQPTMFKSKDLNVPTVFKNLKEIATASGSQSQTKKIGIIMKMLTSCNSNTNEVKFLIRLLEGKLRIGLAEKTVVVSLANAIVLSNNEDATKEDLERGVEIVKQVYSELPSYDLIIPALLDGGVDNLQERCHLTPGIPLKPMLAKPTKAVTEVLDRFEGRSFTCEYKYDGERAQIHYHDGKVKVFSRNSEDMSMKYPDLMEQLPRAIKPGVKNFVIDSEAVAFDKQTKKILPFQELTRRKRKDVKVEDITVKVHIFAFDLLYFNDQPLLHEDLTRRREMLSDNFEKVEDEFAMAKSMEAQSTEEIQAFLEESVKDSCEGLMVKMNQGESAWYTPSKRSMNWLKLKKDYLSGVGDSLDLVVIGGYYGKGKRTNVYGAYLLACYDQDSESYQSICKIGTGFSEEMLDSHYKLLNPLEITAPKSYYKLGSAKPDVYFEPQAVWEVLTADLSLSPVYTAAAGEISERGISLRFPRFIRVRDDKAADDATSSEQVAEMYKNQVSSQSGNKIDYEDDAY
ncbi:ATP-dependent DNA ligase [Wallemia mellicola]|uniref:DNA ligase n=1 Tax=Wallemia mellicola TaxID=1708541 RepID=A0A4T0NEN8_9BASI|nr:ATP-dependent DNA ligase [Wallemia mellicola]